MLVERTTLIAHLAVPFFCLFVALSLSAPLSALEWSKEDWRVHVNTQLRASIGWRLEDRDPRLLGQANQGLPAGTPLGAPTSNTDDGNWNFGKSDTYTKRLGGSTELAATRKNLGLVLGARYYYDFELKDERRARDATGFSRQLGEDTLDTAGADVKLMNAYVQGDFDVGRPLSTKVGRHVLNWGEGLFMSGGIGVINPVDVSAARTPGTRLQDIWLPVNMVSTAIQWRPDLSIEAFYQLDWEPIEQTPCGTYFSSNDTSADGCGPIVLLNVSDATAQSLIASNTAIIPRLQDRQPPDYGQFGVAIHWFADALNGAELGLYFMNYHSRLPFFSGVALDPSQTTPNDLLPVPGLPAYYSEYPKDIRLYGLSFSSTGEEFTFAGEYSFRENQPIQWNASEIVYGGLLRLHSRHLLQRAEEAGTTPLGLAGTAQKGYDRFKVSQLQLSTTTLIHDLFDASTTTLAAELGAVYVHDLPNINDARYGRAAHFGNGNFDGLGQNVFPDINPFSPLNPNAYSCTGAGAVVAVNDNPAYCDSAGYTTAFSWGYVLGMQWLYTAVWPSLNLQPEVYFSHDVNGNSPDPMGLFVAGRKQLGLTLKADYMLGRYTAALSHVRYYGGGRHNVLNDRDHFTASIGMAF